MLHRGYTQGPGATLTHWFLARWGNAHLVVANPWRNGEPFHLVTPVCCLAGGRSRQSPSGAEHEALLRRRAPGVPRRIPATQGLLVQLLQHLHAAALRGRRQHGLGAHQAVLVQQVY